MALDVLIIEDEPDFLPGYGSDAWDLVTIDEDPGSPVFAGLTADGNHSGGVSALMGDGSVRFAKDGVDGVTWRALRSIGGGEVISSDSD